MSADLFPSNQAFADLTDINGILEINIPYTFKQGNIALLMVTVQLHAQQPPNSAQLPPFWQLFIRGQVRSFSYGFSVDLGPRVVHPSEGIRIRVEGAPPGIQVTGVLHGVESTDLFALLAAASSLIPNTPVVNLSVGAFDAPINGRTSMFQVWNAGATLLSPAVPGLSYKVYTAYATIQAAGGGAAPVSLSDDTGLTFHHYMANAIGNVPPLNPPHPYTVALGRGLQLNNPSGAPFTGSVDIFWNLS